MHYIVESDVFKWLDMLLVGIFDNDMSDLMLIDDGVFLIGFLMVKII